MLILRVFLLLIALLLVLSGIMYLFTRNRRYLALAWQIVRFTIFLVLIFLLLLMLERYALVAWHVLL
ncbi:MAG TPA: hypothetical protein VFF41_02280 [Gallionella sp.]|nr:hypothetical protein [Gallionella sp.]